MSDATADHEAFIAKLRRDNAETEKLVAEMRKLTRDRLLAPVIAIGGILVGALGIAVGVLGLLIRIR